jgi:hypothetical protein
MSTEELRDRAAPIKQTREDVEALDEDTVQAVSAHRADLEAPVPEADAGVLRECVQ